jgi:predicted transcriptional regulator
VSPRRSAASSVGTWLGAVKATALGSACVPQHRDGRQPTEAASKPFTTSPPIAQATGRMRWPSVDTAVESPYAVFMNLQVPPELEAKLTRLAAETGRTADQVALDLLASSMDHDDWFRAEIENGRAAADEGRLLEHNDVAARMDRRYRS